VFSRTPTTSSPGRLITVRSWTYSSITRVAPNVRCFFESTRSGTPNLYARIDVFFPFLYSLYVCIKLLAALSLFVRLSAGYVIFRRLPNKHGGYTVRTRQMTVRTFRVRSILIFANDTRSRVLFGFSCTERWRSRINRIIVRTQNVLDKPVTNSRKWVSAYRNALNENVFGRKLITRPVRCTNLS